MRLDRVSGPPLHQQIQTALRTLIEDRAFAPGDKLPPESQLAERFGVNRLTIRQAIAELNRRGLITTRHGVGSFVTGLPEPLEVDINPDDWQVENDRGQQAAIVAGRSITEILLDSRVVEAAPHVRDSLGAGDVLWLETRTDIDGAPSIRNQYWTRTALNAQEVEARLIDSFTAGTLTGIVGQRMHYGWRSFDAVGAGTRSAQVLDVPVGTPMLRRRGLNTDAEGTPLLCLQRDAPSGRMTLRIVSPRFRADGGAGCGVAQS